MITTQYGLATNTKQVNELFDHGKIDIKNLSGSNGKLVYDCEGYIYVYDIEKRHSERLIVDIQVEKKETRPRYQNVAKEIRNADISPSGARVVFEARGELLTVPAKKSHPVLMTAIPSGPQMEKVSPIFPIWMGSMHSMSSTSSPVTLLKNTASNPPPFSITLSGLRIVKRLLFPIIS